MKIDLGTEGSHLFEIVTFDEDDLADGSGKAKITWMSKTPLNTSHRMNPTKSGNTEGTGAIGGWDKSEMKQYVLNTIAPLFPTDARNAVKTVTKYTRIYDTTGTTVNDVETSETLWLAGLREMFGAITNAETQGPIYSEAFPDDASRVKSKVGASSASWWWLRSTNNSNSFYRVNTDGSRNNNSASISGAVVLGFCT